MMGKFQPELLPCLVICLGKTLYSMPIGQVGGANGGSTHRSESQAARLESQAAREERTILHNLFISDMRHHARVLKRLKTVNIKPASMRGSDPELSYRVREVQKASRRLPAAQHQAVLQVYLGSESQEDAVSCEAAIEAAKQRFTELEGIPNWQIHASFIEAALLEGDAADARREPDEQRSADDYGNLLAHEEVRNSP